MHVFNLFTALTFEERAELVRKLDSWSRKVTEVYYDPSSRKWYSSQDSLPTRSWWQELNRLSSECAADDYRDWQEVF